GPPPAPAGGSFVAGTYDLVSKTLYTDPDGGADAAVTVDLPPSREVSIVTGSRNSFSVQNAILSGSTWQRQNGTVTTDGNTSLTFTPTCPLDEGGGGNPGSVGYSVATTAAGTTITVISPVSGNARVRVDVYLKR